MAFLALMVGGVREEPQISTHAFHLPQTMLDAIKNVPMQLKSLATAIKQGCTLGEELALFTTYSCHAAHTV